MTFLNSSSFSSCLRPIAALVCVVAAPSVMAVEPFVIRDIRIEGLQRTDPGAVFAALPFRVGDTYQDEKGAAALRSLFATGLFKDVRIDIDGQVVVIIIDERATIAAVSFVGMKEFDKDTLGKSLKDAGIGEGLPYDRSIIDRAEQEIKRQYLSKSLYGAEVVTTITPIERNRVNITFTMTEGDVAQIKEIRIVGARTFSESALLSQFELTTGGWLTWYTKNDRYSRAKLNADLEALRAYYTNRGFVEFAVTSTQVTISPDKEDIAIAITVNEGLRYTVSGVKLEGQFLGKEAEFGRLVSVRAGEAYRGEDVAETTRRMTERFGEYGYAFARVEARPQIDRSTGQVTLILSADPQRRVYVRRINVAGNARTRDEVVRREFRQFESAWYDGEKIKLSRDRIERLGYFKDVSIDTNEVAGAIDQVDLTVTVEEKPTGNLLVGLTYSGAEKLGFSASIKQDNIFGSGSYFGLDFNTSRLNRSLVFSTVNPYFTKEGVSRSFDLFYRTSRPLNSQSNQYQLATAGTSLRFGVPFTDFDTVFFGVGAESTKIIGDVLPNSYILYRAQYGARSSTFPLTIGWARDSRDSLFSPTRGTYQRVNLELAPTGDARYWRSNYQVQHFVPLGTRFTLGFNSEFGLGKPIGDRRFPIFKNFFGGGLGSVRVFDTGSLGPVDVTGTYIGGTKRFNLNTELYVPVPGAGKDKTLRLFGFVDLGNVWGEAERVRAGDLRASTGLGLSWVSPVGPLRLSWGVPIRSKPNDKLERFQFQVGAAFQ
jgi:outer membrane protein insertion porin family